MQITTNREKNRKLIDLDGFDYKIRRPGAGESMDLMDFGKEVEQLEKRKDDLTPEETQQFEEKSMKMLKIVLSLFDDLGNGNAKVHLRAIDPEELMNVIKEVFDPKPKVS